MKEAALRDIFKKASKGVCTSTVVVSPEPLSSTPSTSSAIKMTENMKAESDHPEPAEQYIQMEPSSD
jgi:hypothetical protein